MLERTNDVSGIIHEVKKTLHLNYRLFAATMRNQLQVENPVPRVTNQCVVRTGKLTAMAVNSAKQLRKHVEAATRNAHLVWASGVWAGKVLIKPLLF